MAKKNKFDPLEEAKVKDGGPSAPKKESPFSRKKKKDAPAPKPKAEEAPVEEAAPSPAAPAPKAAPAPAKPKDSLLGRKFKVLEDKMVSIRGTMTRLRKDSIVEARFYGGELGLKRLLDQVKYEEVTE